MSGEPPYCSPRTPHQYQRVIFSSATRVGPGSEHEIRKEWPQEYRQVVARRIKLIERDRNIGLVERPECKRRWQSEPWESKERDALTTWLLDRCEERSLWYGPDDQPHPMTVYRLADRLRADADVVAVARLLAGPEADLADVLAGIIADEHVPCVARVRYKPEGLLKRGKLDVSRERFISYPYASPASDGCATPRGSGPGGHSSEVARPRIRASISAASSAPIGISAYCESPRSTACLMARISTPGLGRTTHPGDHRY